MVIKCNGKRYSRSVVRGKILIALFFFYVEIHVKILSLFSESFLHLLLWLIFRQPHPDFINVRTAYASKNLGTIDKKSSHKIKHKKIPRVHIFPILWSLWSKIFVFIYIIFLYSFIEFLPSNCSLYFRSRQRERSLNNILFYIEHLLEKWKKNAKAYDKNCHRQELGNAMIETAWKENIK